MTLKQQVYQIICRNSILHIINVISKAHWEMSLKKLISKHYFYVAYQKVTNIVILSNDKIA